MFLGENFLARACSQQATFFCAYRPSPVTGEMCPMPLYEWPQINSKKPHRKRYKSLSIMSKEKTEDNSLVTKLLGANWEKLT